MANITVPSTIERKMAQRLAAAKVRLRFDKVVVRLVDGLKAALAEVVPEGEAVIFTVTAPIRRSAKTRAAIEALVRAGLADGEVRETIEGNQVRLRRVTQIPAQRPRVVGFVHNPESDAGLILNLVESHLLGRSPPSP